MTWRVLVLSAVMLLTVQTVRAHADGAPGLPPSTAGSLFGVTQFGGPERRVAALASITVEQKIKTNNFGDTFVNNQFDTTTVGQMVTITGNGNDVHQGMSRSTVQSKVNHHETTDESKHWQTISGDQNNTSSTINIEKGGDGCGSNCR